MQIAWDSAVSPFLWLQPGSNSNTVSAIWCQQRAQGILSFHTKLLGLFGHLSKPQVLIFLIWQQHGSLRRGSLAGLKIHFLTSFSYFSHLMRVWSNQLCCSCFLCFCELRCKKNPIIFTHSAHSRKIMPRRIKRPPCLHPLCTSSVLWTTKVRCVVVLLLANINVRGKVTAKIKCFWPLLMAKQSECLFFKRLNMVQPSLC